MLDVIIIGGGLSGLTAGRQLLLQGVKNFVILEAKDRVGGRSFAKPMRTATGSYNFDVGGQWVAKTQPYVLKLAKELGIAVYQQYETGFSLVRLRDGTIRKYKGSIPSINVFALLELHFLLKYVNELMVKVNIEDPSLTPNAAELDKMTLNTAVEKKAWSSSCRELFDIAVRLIFGCETKDMSLLYFLWYAKCAGGAEALIETRDGGQDFKLSGSAYQLSTMQAEVVKDHIKLNTIVRRITQHDDHVVVGCEGVEFQARRVIVAVPPHLSAAFTYSPSLPLKKMRLLQHSLPGCAFKVLITYSTSFWRQSGFSGSIVDNASIITGVYDGCTSDNGDNPAVIIFIAGDVAVNVQDRTPQERREAVLKALSEFWGSQALTPIDYIEQNWSAEPFNGGCPVPHLPPGVLSLCGSYLRKQIGRIHWAGTETATCWSGFLNGAIQAGERASTEVLQALAVENPPAPTQAPQLVPVSLDHVAFAQAEVSQPIIEVDATATTATDEHVKSDDEPKSDQPTEAPVSDA